MRAVADSRLKSLVRPRWQVGRVRIDGDWETCQARWSRKHRQHMAWSARQLAAKATCAWFCSRNLRRMNGYVDAASLGN